MKKILFTLLIVSVSSLCFLYAQTEETKPEGTPVVLAFTLQECLDRVENDSLRAIAAELDVKALDIINTSEYPYQYNANWLREFIPNLSYQLSYDDTDIVDRIDENDESRYKYLSNHELQLTAPLFSRNFLDAMEQAKDNMLQKEMIMSELRSYVFFYVREYYSEIVLRTELAGKLEAFLEELRNLQKTNFGLQANLESYLKSEIDRYIAYAEDDKMDNLTNIKENKMYLLLLMNYPVTTEFELTDSVASIDIDYTADLEKAIQNSYEIRYLTQSKMENEYNGSKQIMGLLPRVYAKITSEVVENLHFGIEGMLNTTYPGASNFNPGEFAVNLVSTFELPEYQKYTFGSNPETTTYYHTDIDKIDFTLSLRYSSNDILNSLESRKYRQNKVNQYEMDIQIEIADIIQVLQAELINMEINQNTIRTDVSFLEISDRQLKIFPDLLRSADLAAVNELVSIISRRRALINNSFSNSYNQHHNYHSYLRKIDGYRY